MFGLALKPRVQRLSWPVDQGILAYVLGFATLLLVVPLDPEVRKPLSNLGQLATPIVAAALCWLAAARMASSRAVSAWRLLALSNALFALGQAVWVHMGLALGIDDPPLSLGDVFWVLFYPPAVAALLLLIPSGQKRLAQTASLIDSLVFTMGAAALSWWFVLQPTLREENDLLVALVNVAYPLGDLMLAFAVVSVILRLPLERVPGYLFYLLAAYALLIVADSGYVMLMFADLFESGGPLDLLWTVGFAFIALAALEQLNARSGGPAGRRPQGTFDLSATSTARMVLPYLALPSVGLVAFLQYTALSEQAEDSAVFVFACALAVVALVLLRQFITLVENGRLSLALSALTRDLEARVAQRTAELTRRTEELTLLNQAATVLSRCLTLDEAVSRGLELALQAVRRPSGVVWLFGPEGRVVLTAGRGMSEEDRILHEVLPAKVPEVDAALRGGRPVHLRPRELGHLSAAGSREAPPSVLVVPLESRRTLLGALALVDPADSGPDDTTLQLAQAIGAAMGTTIENVRRYEEVKQLADRDSVTGLLNHRAFHRRLQQEVGRVQRAEGKLALIMMDLDGFKLFNDTYGHPVGDRVLRDVAGVLASSAREYDVIARYGGDEFAALLPDATLEEAVTAARRFRAELADHPYFAAGESRVPIKMSFGIAAYPDDAREAQQIVVCADANLYESKHRGGDRITGGEGRESEQPHRSGSFGVLEGLVTAVDNKDHYTRRHSEDVMRYALAMAESLGLSEESQRTLRIAGLLHDVGKIGVPDRLLRKPGRLESDEFAVIKQHALLGEMIIKEVPNLVDVLAAVGAHHERYDGQGYPRGLKQEEIPLLGRILAVADAYSAMTTDRPYRTAMTAEEARKELLRVSGSQLDPELVRALLDVAPEPTTEELAQVH